MARFTSLRVWHAARELLRNTSAVTQEMRSEGDLKSQMRRSVISIASNIAEGSERGSQKDFRRFLYMAQASNAKFEAQVTIAGDIGCLDTSVAEQLVAQSQIIGRMLGKLIIALSAGS